jgi:hypothetical protein
MYAAHWRPGDILTRSFYFDWGIRGDSHEVIDAFQGNFNWSKKNLDKHMM